MAEIKDTITFEVDFNDRDSDGRLLASMRFASGPRVPEVGEWVWTADDEGHSCVGRVVALDGLIVHIELDRATWTRNSAMLSNRFAAPLIYDELATTSGPEPVLELV